MPSINQEVRDILNRHLSIQKCIARGIINNRALAQYLKEKHNLAFPLDGIISAIRRYSPNTSTMDFSDDFLRQMSIFTKDNVAKITLKDKAFKEVCSDYLTSKILKENIRLIKSKEMVTLLVRQKDIQEKLAVFTPGDVIETVSDLAEIRIEFPADVSTIKGITARISLELAMRDITIVEIIFARPSLLLYVHAQTMVESFKALMEMKH